MYANQKLPSSEAPKLPTDINITNTTMPQRIDTPKKNRILGACEFSRKHGKVLSYSSIFRENGISKSAGFRLLRDKDRPRGRPQKRAVFVQKCPHSNRTSGRRKELTEEDVDHLVNFIQTGGFKARVLNYKQLVEAAGLDVDVSPRTVQCRLAKRGFKRYPAEEVDSLPEEEKRRRAMN